MGNASDQKRYEERRALGICVDCAAPVDYRQRYVRCKACRERHTAYLREWRKKHPQPVYTLKELAYKKAIEAEKTARQKAMEEAAKRSIAAAKFNRKLEKCKKCEWGTHAGNKVLCPFPEGGCMKEERREIHNGP